jgi:hypothetical protein
MQVSWLWVITRKRVITRTQDSAVVPSHGDTHTADELEELICLPLGDLCSPVELARSIGGPGLSPPQLRATSHRYPHRLL